MIPTSFGQTPLNLALHQNAISGADVGGSSVQSGSNNFGGTTANNFAAYLLLAGLTVLVYLFVRK
jgi:hypothetical protein